MINTAQPMQPLFNEFYSFSSVLMAIVFDLVFQGCPEQCTIDGVTQGGSGMCPNLLHAFCLD